MQNIEFEYTYKSLSKLFYTDQNVYKYPDAKVVILNYDLAKSLAIDFNKFTEKELLDFLLGYSSEKPISQAYAGHQFGNFTMLGDGRAILLGEYTKPNKSVVDFQLKGAGRTSYSRGGDGKATLSAMLREYVVSEAMYSLKIPTSRILAVISTGENIFRNKIEQGAIAVRVASSHIRVGTFQYAATQGKKYLQELLDYTLQRHDIAYSENKALGLLEHMVEKQASLIVEWERVGFIHGVMNSDNMTISGETIDYGPCAFMDEYSPEAVFSSIDKNGRYAFANQAPIAGWNIARLAESLLPLIATDENKAIELAQGVLSSYFLTYETKRQKMLLNKIGLAAYQTGDEKLVKEFLAQLDTDKLDYTNTFYTLTYASLDKFKSKSWAKWLSKWQARVASVDDAISLMQKTNPIIIPRNHQVERVLEAAQNGNFSLLISLVETMKTPYSFNENMKKFMLPPTQDEKVKATFCGV